MPKRRYIRKRRGTAWTSESSKRANKARWDQDRARRDAEEPERLAEIAYWKSLGLPCREGDTLGCLQSHNFASGKVHRWTIKIGDRSDRVTMHAPDGRSTGSHGWTWVMERLRGHLSGNRAF
jgi:hypothetical protein